MSAATKTGAAPLAASLRGVRKHYRLGEIEVPALRGIDLELPRGIFTVVGGPSGSGKSTLLNLLGCIDSPDSGSIEIDGRDVAALDDDARTAFRARHVGFVFQNYNLIPVLSALENVEYPLQLVERNPARRREQAMAALAEVGLGGLERRLPSALSGGQRQRVAVARALVKRPALVLADEPTANLDQSTGRELIELMRSIQRHTGASFIFSSHDPQLMREADLLVRIVDGQIVRTEERAAQGETA
jgi:putative ABC transport system ATP-binding protein